MNDDVREYLRQHDVAVAHRGDVKWPAIIKDFVENEGITWLYN